MELWKKPSVAETFVDILLCAVPIWVALIMGLFIGWAWRPSWETGLIFLGLRSKLRFLWIALPPAFSLWFAFTAFPAVSVFFNNYFKGKHVKSAPAPAPAPVSPSEGVSHSAMLVSCNEREEKEDLVTENDLQHLLQLLERNKDGRMVWKTLMERSNSNLACQVSCHEPMTGPYVLRSRTVFEDATPELIRDFFWDDEFRSKCNSMIKYFKILDECPYTGTMIVHWVKKFPFFCGDREYIIGRRIWEAGKTYYCVTKVVPYPELHKRDKPKRVELYFSSWVIRAVESHKGDGQKSACEVTLVHYEDMGIPKELAKLGVRYGMWGTVKKLHSSIRAYHNARKSEVSLSRCALMARITTKFSSDESTYSLESKEAEGQALVIRGRKDQGIDWKWIVIGGAAALVCGFHSGIIGRALLLGTGQKIARR